MIKRYCVVVFHFPRRLNLVYNICPRFVWKHYGVNSRFKKVLKSHRSKVSDGYPQCKYIQTFVSQANQSSVVVTSMDLGLPLAVDIGRVVLGPNPRALTIHQAVSPTLSLDKKR